MTTDRSEPRIGGRSASEWEERFLAALATLAEESAPAAKTALGIIQELREQQVARARRETIRALLESREHEALCEHLGSIAATPEEVYVIVGHAMNRAEAEAYDRGQTLRAVELRMVELEKAMRTGDVDPSLKVRHEVEMG